MKLRYYIDQIEIVKLKEFTHIVFNGWCVNLKGKLPTYSVKINNKDVECKIAAISRPDVCKKYNLDNQSLQNGLRISLKYTGSIKKIELYASVNDEKECLKIVDEKQVLKLATSETVEYAIDRVEFNEDTCITTVCGWATSYYHEDIYFEVTNSKNQKIEINNRITNREDLYRLNIVDKDNKYCGFMISFPALKHEKYYLTINSKTFEKKIDLSRVNVVPLTMKLKRLIKSINSENVKKGLAYLRKNGFVKFLKRVKEGPKGSGITYSEWFEQHKVSASQLEKQKETKFKYSPKVSIIVPTFNTPIQFLKEMIDSVINQSYTNWQLCIADGSDDDNEARKIIKEYSEKDHRISVCYLDENYGISGNTNKALELATGEYVGLFDHDDLLTPDALYEVVSSLQKTKHDIVYTDEDKLDNKSKKFVDPNFKPDYNVDLFRSHNYITHFFVVKTDIIKGIGGFDSQYDGAQDYDLMFRCIERAQSIYHIPKILYHWRMHAASTAENPESKMYAYDAGKRAIESHYKRIGVEATVELMPKPLWGMYKTTYSIKDNPLVSIIIPNMEHKEILKTCIDSLYHINTYKNFEIIIVENNSKSQEIFDYYDELEKTFDNIRIVKWEKEFNYSALNNFGVQFAKGDYYLFLNNDTEVIAPTAVSEMLGCCMREEVGIVGAKLLYEDDTVQHAGVVIGFGGFAGHVFTGIEKDDYGYMVRARINCDYSAVTAACMMVDKKVFEQVNGFDEQFKVACNDIDFCLRVRQLNKLVVYNAFSLWHHYESKSRGYEDNIEKIKRFESEVSLFQERWIDILNQGDPYYNSNFKIEHGPFVL